MTPQLALFLYGIFIFWLFLQDSRHRKGISPALWLAVAWVAILASRPVSVWLGMGGGGETLENESEGSSIDRDIFLFLMVAGIFVLKKRKVNWRMLISNNRWLFLFYLFFGFSVFWSGYSFVTFKRWFKDLGNVVMVLVILTETNPVEAVKAVFARVAYLLLPLSVLLIKFYPDLGISYGEWVGQPVYQGVTLGKNMLGATVLILTLFLIWDFLQFIRSPLRLSRKMDILIRFLLLVMAMWLLHIANSATSLACAILGSFALVALTLPFVQKRLKNLVAYSILGALLLMILSTMVDLKADATGALGRDTTLTGRNVIWKAVLAEHTNPLIGTGFYSFWLGGRAEKLSRENGYFFRLNQAHNGYLEMYLNGGAIGVCLLLAMLVAAGKNITRQLLVDTNWAGVRLVFWLIIIMHNWAEATFCRLSPLWFVLLLVIMECPRLPTRKPAASRLAGV